jgi:predicted ATPase/tetratricopeptide (TPR) repeat protein/class 3 adenylate cyclase
MSAVAQARCVVQTVPDVRVADPPAMNEVRAVLLTDIVDSTSLWQTLGDEATTALWVRHDRLARDLLPEWRGREVDKSDGLLLLFATAADAVGYVLAYHRKLAERCSPMKARSGLHVGPVVLRDNSADDIARGAKPLEVEGRTKAIAARIMSIARGGQTLLTRAAYIALGAHHYRVQPHGHWRLQGIAEPLELVEVGDAETTFVPPADGAKVYRVARHGDLWLPTRHVRHGLPAERDAFIGREEAIDDLGRRLLGGVRLVSILGMGGVGKTRLAMRFGWAWLGDFHPGGVWFCDLSSATGLDGVVDAVGRALGIPLGRDDPVVQLGHAIAGRGRCLLILDNFEQVSRHAEQTVGRWLEAAPEAAFIVTTREVLGIAGEQVLTLPTLPRGDAIDLFKRRAHAWMRDFAPCGDDDRVIETLTELLDCLPLAIELAAARVPVMPPATLLSRMSERFRLLASAGGRVDRQATLRATFDWSWDLLVPDERIALAQLSVFEGGFTMGAAEAVLRLGDGHAAAPWAVDVLQSLLNKSFVRQSDQRFDLLASVQEYAAERLRTPGSYPGSGPDAVRAAQVAHGAYAAALDAADVPAVELANCMAACRRAVHRRDAEVAVATLERAWSVLRLTGPFRVAVELAAAVSGMGGLDARSSARAQRVAGRALELCGRYAEARKTLEAALHLARQAGDRRCEGQVLSDAGFLLAEEGRTESSGEYLQAALAIARELDDPVLECDALRSTAILQLHTGHLMDALAHCEKALAISRRIGESRMEGTLLDNLAVLHANLGDLEPARKRFEASLSLARRLGDRKWEGNALSNLGHLSQIQGRYEEARAMLQAAVSLSRELGDLRLECIGRGNLGAVLDKLGRFDEARTHYESALLSAQGIDDRRSEGQFLGALGLLHAREARFAEARRCFDRGEALLGDAGDASSLGILLCNRAEAEYVAKRPGDAGQALARAEKLAERVGAGAESELGQALMRTKTTREGGAPP